MSTGSDAATPQPDGLQFDHAEFEQAPPSAVSCAACKRPIEDHYYEINGTIVCEPCKGVISTRLGGGSWVVRFLRALLFGTGAAIVGTIGYVLVSVVTGYDLGLVSIVVGYLIGRAVRAGSRNLGGLGFQLLAVGLTYLAIGTTYTTTYILWSLERPKAIPAKAPADPAKPNPAPGLKDEVARPAFSGPELLAAVGVFLFFVVRMPVMLAQQSVIKIVIVGFALWQAWKMNVRLKLAVTGPYAVGDPGAGGPMTGATAHA